MRDLVYAGPADVRILEERDFAKMGIEHKHSIEFQRGIKQGVSDKIAEALLTHHLVLGEFIELPEEEEVPLVPDDEDADDDSDDSKLGETVDDAATAASENADGHPQESASSVGSRPRSGKQRAAS